VDQKMICAVMKGVVSWSRNT